MKNLNFRSDAHGRHGSINVMSLGNVSRFKHVLDTKTTRTRHELGLYLHRTVTLLLLILTLACGNVWGASPLIVDAPTKYIYTQDGVTVQGTYASEKINNTGSQSVFKTNSSSSIFIYSESTNINSISFKACKYNDNAGNCLDVAYSTGGAFTTPTSASGFTATKDGSTLSSLQNINLNGQNGTENTIVITFTSPVKAIILSKNSNDVRVRNISVAYGATSSYTTYYAAHLKSTSPYYEIDTDPGSASSSVTKADNGVTVNTKSYLKPSSDILIDLGSGHTFAAGDQIVIDVAGSGTNKSATIVFKTSSGTSVATVGAGKVTTAFSNQFTYVVQASDGIQGQQSAKINISGSDTRIYSYSVVRASASGCSSYSFHTGTGDDATVKTTNTQTCFTQVGSSTEWQITNYTIPADTKYFVGKLGSFYNDGLGSNNSHSQVTDWATNMYIAPAMDPSDESNTPKLGNSATGAKGTLRIYDDSNWNNLQVAFIPDGYGITYGGTGYAFNTTATDNLYETGLVTLPNVSSTTYAIGLKTATSGTYVKYGKSKSTDEAIGAMGVSILKDGKKKIYLDPNVSYWGSATAKYSIWDVTNSKFNGFMTESDGLYVGEVDDDCTTINLVRLNTSTSDEDIANSENGYKAAWDKKWNQTANISLGSACMKYTITAWGESGKDSPYSSAVINHPATGDYGKFRIWNNTKSDNFYVHFVPYYVLTYDENGGSGTTAQTERNSESSTKTVSVASNGFTAPTGYSFAGWATSDSRADAGTVDYAAGASYTLTANATLHAVWQAKEYTITLDDESATTSVSPSSVTATYNSSTIASITNPLKTGYTFGGWYSGDDGTGTLIIDTNGDLQANTAYTGEGGIWTNDGDVTLHAKWTAKTTAITLEAGEGGTDGSATATYGTSTITDYVAASRTGYTLDKYQDGSKNNILKDDGTLNSGDKGSILDDGLWVYDGATITLYAQWTAIEYTIAYNLAGGSVVSPNPTSYTIESSAITLNNPTKTGYTFAGWTGTDLVSATTTVTIAAGSTGNRSYTATWTAIVPSSVSLKASTTITVGGTETLTATISPAVVADNTITWSTSDADVATVDGGVVTAVAAGTATITATTVNGKTATCEVTVAPAVTYTVTYVYNGATSGDETESATGASVTLPNPSKTGYTLQGWYTSSGSLAGAATATYNPTSDITLYALWREDACAGGGGSTTVFSISGMSWNSYSAANTTITIYPTGTPDKTYTATLVGATTVSVVNTNAESKSMLGSNSIKIGSNDVSMRFTLTSGTLQNGDVISFTNSGTNQLSFTTTATRNTTPATTSNTYTISKGDGLAGSSSLYVWRPSSTPEFTAFTITRAGGSGTCYYVTYNGNGADGGFTKDEASHPSGSDVTVASNSFTKTGYTFTGWKTEPSGGTSYAAGGTISGISGNMTLYAQWEEEVVCSNPADPTGLSAGSITSSGATFTITDAANTNNYEIVCKTTSGTPAADATPTQTGTSKTIAVTGLNVYTDYYAYVRAVCDASHKSNWVALTGSSFKTLCNEPTTTLGNGAYTIGGSALDLSTLISSNNSSGAITYTVTNANGTGATIAGTSFTATTAGTANISATQAANGGHCEKTMNATVTVSATPAGTTYYLVTSTDQLNTTDTYVIMDDGKAAMMGVATGSNAYLNKITSGFTVAGDKSTVTVTSSDVNTLTLQAENSAWNIIGKDSHYITTNTTVSSNLYGNATSGSGTDDFVFSFTDGKAIINRPSSSYHIYYTSSKGFNQSESATNIRLYTSSAPAECSAAGLAYETASVAKNVGDAAFTNALTNPHSVAVTYSSSVPGVATVNETSGMVTIVGSGSTTITATWAGNATYCAGTATYTLTISGGCTPQSLVKTQLTSVNAGTTIGYNDGQYAGDPVIATFQKTPIDGGYKMTGSAKLFVTIKGGFVADDKINIVITQASDLTYTIGKLPIFYDASSPKLLTTIDAASAGTYTYTLTASDITTLGSNKTIGVFRSSGETESNPYVKSVEVEGCREWATCTAPDAIVAGSVTGEGATFTITDAENTNNYEIYYSTSSTAPTAETSATVSGISSKSRAVTGLTASTTYYYWVRSNCGGATKSSWVAGTPTSFTTSAAAATHSVTYDGNEKTGGSVPTDDNDYEEGNVVTVKANTGSLVKTGQTFLGWSTNATPSSGTFYPAGYKFYMPNEDVTLYAVWGSTGCETLVNVAANSSTTVSATVGSGTVNNSSSQGYAGAIKLNSSGYIELTPKAGSSFAAGNKITITMYCGADASKTIGFRLADKDVGNSMSASVAKRTEKTFEYTIVSGDITDGKIKIYRYGSESWFVSAIVEDCSGGGATGHTVTFNMNGKGSAISPIANVPSGSMIGAPVPSPTAVGAEFGGWYREAGCTNAWNFGSSTISKDTTLYAKWADCAPSISAHPAAATYTQGAAATALSVTASGDGLNYQWYTSENGSADISGSSAIPGATSTSYTPSTSLLGTIYYFCVVSNTCGNAVSSKAAITVNDSHPAPTANWDIEEPEEGGKGFTFSIEVNKNDGTTNWDGELIASMLTLSDNAILDGSSIVVDNTNKTISGTYGVKAGSSSPVTFYLLLPATTSQSATRLDHDRTFTPCAGGGVGDSYNVPVRKDYEKDASNNYRWVTPGAGEITYAVGSSISSAKAASTVASVFDSIMSNDKQYVWVKTYEANTKTIRLHVETSGANISVNALYKNTVYATAADKDIVSSDDYSVSYDGSGSAENTGAKGTHYMDITFDSPLAANDIICVKFSSSKVKAYGAVLTTVGDGGDQTTSLAWNTPSPSTPVTKNEDAADFSFTANRSNTEAQKSLGEISYSSSNTAVATVNATTGLVHIADAIDFGAADYKEVTITATLAASGCYKEASITYTLRVNKYVCTEAAGTVSIKTDVSCSEKVLTVTGFEAGAKFQWQKDGVDIPSATSQDYTATTSGEYSVVTNKTCAVASTNSIKLSIASATASKIVDSWYVKNGRRTPDIALVQTTGATSFTVTSGGTITEIGGCTFELKDDGIIYLHGQKEDGSAPSDMTAGDMTITITVSGCTGALSGLNITIHKQAETAKPSVAFVVDGTKRAEGGTATSVLEAKTSERPIWKYLANSFTLTGCNAYWSVDSKELRQYYSQFDAILITDDPSTDTKGTGGVSYVKAFGTMVDVRPVLTMEAFVGKFKDGGWHVYDATPTSPNPRQVEMKLECKNHDIFKGLDPETSDNVRTTTDEHGNEYWHVIMVDTTVAPYHNTSKDYKALPALQGFDKKKFSNMLGVGTIAEETLQGGVERQEEPAARMMILGIQNEAMAALTIEGKLIVKNAIEYLLKTNMEDVNDCSNYFTGGPSGTGDDWATPENWSSGKVPDFESRVRILRPVVISDDTKAIVARVDIATSGKSKWLDGECNGSVTVNPRGALIVSGKIRRAEAPRFGIDDLMPTENDDLIVKAATDTPHRQGALIFDNSDGDTHAVVEMWNPSYWVVEGGKKKKFWSYVAVPIQEADIPNFFWHGFTYLYDETSGWIKKGDGTSLYPFQGIGASLQDGNMETFYGPLATTESQDITLTYTDDKGEGMNLIGNSWTAPIQIVNFEEDDFGDAAAEVWVFNTGNKNDGTPGSGSSSTAGQWNTIPINAPSLPGYEGLKVIPAMQAFEVNTTSETTLHLDYDRLVRAGRENLNEPMRAPRRSAAKQIEATMRVRVSGESTHTDVYLLKDARFSDGFDNGWDGHFLSGDDRSAQLYAISEEEGKLAFLAQPEIEGTQLGFAPSKKDTEYTFSFSYDGDEEYYLNDIKLQQSTQIDAENKYLFTYEEGDAANRFYISRQPLGVPEVATGNDAVKEDIKAVKIIYNDKLYIIRAGRVYSAEGILVK